MPVAKVSNAVIGPDPVQVGNQVMARTQFAQQRRELQQRQQAQRAEREHQELNKFWQSNEDIDTWEPFASQMQQSKQRFQLAFQQQLNQSEMNASELSKSAGMQQAKSQLLAEASYYKSMGAVAKEMKSTLDAGEFYNEGTAKRYLNNLVFRKPDFNKSPLEYAESLSSPGLLDQNKIVSGVVKNIQNQIAESGSGGIYEQGGKIYGSTVENKLRFATDENGRVAEGVVSHVLNMNDQLGETIRFDMARQAYEAQHGKVNLEDPEDHQAVKQLYEEQFRDDTSDATKDYIFEKTRDILEQHQQKAFKNNRVSYGNKPKPPKIEKPKPDTGPFKDAETLSRVRERYDTLTQIVDDYSQTQANSLIGQKTGQGTITGIKINKPKAGQKGRFGTPFGSVKPQKGEMVITLNPNRQQESEPDLSNVGATGADEDIVRQRQMERAEQDANQPVTIRIPMDTEEDKASAMSRLNNLLQFGSGKGMITNEDIRMYDREKGNKRFSGGDEDMFSDFDGEDDPFSDFDES